jgi:hypothetical protein
MGRRRNRKRLWVLFDFHLPAKNVSPAFLIREIDRIAYLDPKPTAVKSAIVSSGL